MLNPEQLFPALVLGSPSAERPAVGHGLVVQLVDDSGSPVEAGPAVEEAHRLALANLARFADDSPDLSIQVLGSPDAPLHILLYSDHPRASACLLLPDLYEHASDVLKETDLLACVPQRDSLVVFPKRDRERLVAQLREIEADAKHPLTFKLFALSMNGVVPFSE